MSAQSHDSVPPAPGWISKMQFSWSYFPFNNRSNLIDSIFFVKFLVSSTRLSNRFWSGSNFNNSNNSREDDISFVVASSGSTTSFKLFISFIVCSAFSLLFQKSSFIVSFSNSFIWFFLLSQSKWPP